MTTRESTPRLAVVAAIIASDSETGDGEGKLLVNLALAVRLGGGKPLVPLRDARQLSIRVGHFSDLLRIKLPGPTVRRTL